MKEKTTLYGLLLITAIALAYAIFVSTVFWGMPKDGERNSRGSAIYQVETQPNIPAGEKGELRADCELRFNTNDRNADAEAIAGDIIISECRVRKLNEQVWKGIGRDY